eukprot:5755530-Amphidinium_carterae.1
MPQAKRTAACKQMVICWSNSKMSCTHTKSQEVNLGALRLDTVLLDVLAAIARNSLACAQL